MTMYFAVLFILDVLIGAAFLIVGVTSCISYKEETGGNVEHVSFKRAA